MRWPAFFLLQLVVAGPLLAQQPGGLVERWIEAAGGPRVWDRVRQLEYTITTVWYDSAESEVRRRPRHVRIEKSARGFQLRVEREETAGQYVQFWDDVRGHGWATLDGRALPDTAQAVRETPYVANELFYWMGLPWKLRDPGVHVTQLDASTVDVRFGEGVGLHDGDRYWYYWHDPASPYPTEIHYIEQGRGEADRKRMRLTDWMRLGPATYAGRRQMIDAGGRLVREFLISNVTVNGASRVSGR